MSYIIREVEYAGRGSWTKVWGEALDRLVEAAVEKAVGIKYQSKVRGK